MGLRVVRLNPQGFLVALDCLFGTSPRLEGGAPVIVGQGVVGLDPQGLLVVRNRFVGTS